MADVIYLRIVYETSHAIAGANRLATATSHLAGHQRKAGIAALHLAHGLSEGNISAVSMARSIGHLGGALGGIATAAGLAAGAFILWLRHTQDLEKRTAELTKEVDTARRALDKLLGITTSDTENQLRGLTDRIKELQKELDKPSVWQRILQFIKQIPEHFGGLHTPPKQKSPVEKAIEDFEKLEAIAKRLSATEIAIALGQVPAGVGGLTFRPTGPTGAAFNRPQTFAGPTARGPSFGADLSGLTPHPGIPEVNMVELELTRQQERIVESWKDGLSVMQDSLEEFLVTGKFVFAQLVDELLRIAFRAATDQFVEKGVNAVIDTFKHSAGARRAAGLVP